MVDYYNTAKRIKVVYGKVLARESVIPANKAAIDGHLSYMRARGVDPKTMIKHLYCLDWFFKCLKKVDVRKATREDIERAMGGIESSDLSAETKRDIRAVVKAFYKHLLGEDMAYPKQVAWIKTANRKGKRTLPEDLLTEDDIMALIEGTKYIRNKTIIALLFDAGIRIGELLTMRIKDVDLRSNPAHVMVNGKTGMRQIPIMFSVPYLSRYLNDISKAKPDSPLWYEIGTSTDKDRQLQYNAVRKMLKDTAAKAGIEKRCNPHNFRHSRASYYANRLTEQQLKTFFGWTGDSRMASVYVHLSGRDIDNAVLNANGEKSLVAQGKPKLTVKSCGRCQFSNTVDSKYCNRCGTPLDERVMMEAQSRETDMKQAIAEALKNPKAIEEIVHAYLLMQAKKKR
ncbi:MAG: hypothetical protein BK997_03700 [Candidatus Micrarchaeum sp. ARMAN-1]|nr:MAG: hypothetical protein BK997_03700 [Candidatus Micrarchaeum sp. ARMAN-1]